MRRIRSGPSAVAALVLVAFPGGVWAAGAGHPPVTAREGCVTRQCHARLLEPEPRVREPSVHQPAADGDCSSCHDLALPGETSFVKGAPSAGDGPGRAQPWDLALCAGCHGEALAAKDSRPGATGFTDGRKNLHALHVQAARGRRCLTCHDPHAAPQAKLLRERIPARDSVTIPQEFRAEKNGGWCRTGCHAPKTYRR
jgi:predicted CXXCH cytochrome family protein